MQIQRCLWPIVAAAVICGFHSETRAFYYSLNGHGALNFYQYGIRASHSRSLLEEELSTSSESFFYSPEVERTYLNLALRNINNLASKSTPGNFAWGGYLRSSFFRRRMFPFSFSLYRNDTFTTTEGIGYRALGQGYGVVLNSNIPRLPLLRVSWNDDYHKQLRDREGTDGMLVLSRGRHRRLNLEGFLTSWEQRTNFIFNYSIFDDFLRNSKKSSWSFGFYNYLTPLKRLNMRNQFSVNRVNSSAGGSYTNQSIRFSHVTSFRFSNTQRMGVYFNTGQSKSDGIENRSDALNISFFWRPRSTYQLSGGASFRYFRYADGLTGGSFIYTNHGGIKAQMNFLKIPLILGYDIGMGVLIPEQGREGFYMSNAGGMSFGVAWPRYSLKHRVSLSASNTFNTSSNSLRTDGFQARYDIFSREFAGLLRFLGRSSYFYKDVVQAHKKSISRVGNVEIQMYCRYNAYLSGNVVTGFRRNSSESGVNRSVFVRMSAKVKPRYDIEGNVYVSSSWAFVQSQPARRTTNTGFRISWILGRLFMNFSANFVFRDRGVGYNVFFSLRRTFSVRTWT